MQPVSMGCPNTNKLLALSSTRKDRRNAPMACVGRGESPGARQALVTLIEALRRGAGQNLDPPNRVMLEQSLRARLPLEFRLDRAGFTKSERVFEPPMSRVSRRITSGDTCQELLSMHASHHPSATTQAEGADRAIRKEQVPIRLSRPLSLLPVLGLRSGQPAIGQGRGFPAGMATFGGCHVGRAGVRGRMVKTPRGKGKFVAWSGLLE